MKFVKTTLCRVLFYEPQNTRKCLVRIRLLAYLGERRVCRHTHCCHAICIELDEINNVYRNANEAAETYIRNAGLSRESIDLIRRTFKDDTSRR